MMKSPPTPSLPHRLSRPWVFFQGLLFFLISTTSAFCGDILSPVHHYLELTAGTYQEPGWRDGEFWSALFNGPAGLCVSPDGKKLCVADTRNHRIRMIALDNRNWVSTLSGTGIAGKKDGPLKDALWNLPTQMIFLDQDRFVVFDSGNACLRLVDLKAGSVSSLTGQHPGAQDGAVIPADSLYLPNFAGLAYLASANALYVSNAATGTLWKLDLLKGTAAALLKQDPLLGQPDALAFHEGKLYVSDRATGKVFSLDPASAPVSLVEIGSETGTVGLASTGGFLYALQNTQTLLKRLLPKVEPVLPFKVIGADLFPEGRLGTGIRIGGDGIFAADPTQERRFFIADQSFNIIYSCRDYRFDELKQLDKPNSEGLMDYEYPKAKPSNTYRILLVGTSHLYFVPQSQGLRWETTPKLTELYLAAQASLKASPLNYEVLCLAHASGEEYEMCLWPYYEVPEVVKKYDIDEVVYVAVPQVHPSYRVYYRRPMTSEGIPAEHQDPEYFLKPFAEKKLDPLAARFWKKAFDKHLADLGTDGVPNISEVEFFLPLDDMRDDVKALLGRPFGLLSRKLGKMRTSSGNPVGFQICYAPLPEKMPDLFRGLWTGIAQDQNIPLLDLTGPIRTLRPTLGTLAEGGHEHFFLQGHALLSYLISQGLVEKGWIPLGQKK